MKSQSNLHICILNSVIIHKQSIPAFSRICHKQTINPRAIIRPKRTNSQSMSLNTRQCLVTIGNGSNSQTPSRIAYKTFSEILRIRGDNLWNLKIKICLEKNCRYIPCAFITLFELCIEKSIQSNVCIDNCICTLS